MLTSLLSRAYRSLELRIEKVTLDYMAEEFIRGSIKQTGDVSLLAHRPGGTDYAGKEAETRVLQKLTQEQADLIFLEVSVTDASEFKGETLHVTGSTVDGFEVLKCTSPAVPNAIAAVLLHIRNTTDTIPHAYLGWTEGHPLSYVFRYLIWGEGEIAPLTREILREIEKNPEKRPKMHVG